jgi:hypothetical protein
MPFRKRIWNASSWFKASYTILLAMTLGSGLTSCQDEALASPRHIALDQAWELKLGNVVEGFPVVAGLGDISLQVNGSRVKAPFDGEVELAAESPNCIFFSSPEVPAYLFRFCGIGRPQVGPIRQGQSMGRASFLHFATMRRQPEGTWAIVEPSTHVLERSLQRY